MRLLLTLLALIAGMLTPGMAAAKAGVPIAGTEQVDCAGVAVVAASAAATTALRPVATGASPPRQTAGQEPAFAPLGNLAIALSDRPLE